MRRSALLILATAGGVLLSACSTDAVIAPSAEAVLAKGGDGGGGNTVKPGQIQRASFGVSCPLGTSFSGRIDKGFNDRADITLVGVSTPLTPTLTSLGGYWWFEITDVDTGARLLSMATGMGELTPSFQMKVLGATTTPGSHNMRFHAWNTRTVDGVQTIVEDCTVAFALFAK